MPCLKKTKKGLYLLLMILQNTNVKDVVYYLYFLLKLKSVHPILNYHIRLPSAVVGTSPSSTREKRQSYHQGENEAHEADANPIRLKLGVGGCQGVRAVDL